MDVKSTIAKAYSGIGSVYYDLKKYAEAKKVRMSAIAVYQTLGDSEAIANENSNLGLVFYAEKNYKEAERYQKAAIRIYENTGGDIKILSAAHHGLYEIYAATGDYKNALDHYKQYTLLEDSLYNTENTKKITLMQAQYDFDRQVDSIKWDNEIRMAVVSEKNKETILRGIIIGSGLLCLLMIGFFLNRKRLHAKFRLQQMQLKQDAVKARLDTHFVSGTLAAINEYAEANNKEAASRYLLKFSRLIRNVLSNSFEKNVLLKDELQFLEDYFQLARLKYPEGHIVYTLDIGSGIDVNNTLVPPMIFQVLVENALQHAFTPTHGGALQVQVRKQGNTIHCTVADNGIGRKAAKAAQPNERKSYGSSLAEKLLKLWLPDDKSVHFTIEDITGPQGTAQGTRATFSFPFKTY
jgi:tetratricopeptide (TPR) repeat protein